MWLCVTGMHRVYHYGADGGKFRSSVEVGPALYDLLSEVKKPMIGVDSPEVTVEKEVYIMHLCYPFMTQEILSKLQWNRLLNTSPKLS
jgi:hypothetical protein